jgi:hypothetical protein
MIAKAFPTFSGNIPPYKNKSITVFSNLYVYDTPYTVNSHGCYADFYVFPTFKNELSVSFDVLYKKWSSTVPFIKWYTATAWPLEISPYYYVGEQFGIHYNGKFLAKATTATLYLRGNGYAKLTLNSVTTGTIKLGVNESADQSFHATGLSANTYYNLDIWYISTSKYQASDNENLFVVLLKDSTMKDATVLSASRFYNDNDYPSGPNPIKGTILKYVGNIQLDQAKKTSAKLTFKVPVVNSSASSGYKYTADDTLVDVAYANKKIKKFNKIEWHIGYKYPSGTIATITKFTGQVRGWNISKNRDGAAAEIECHDWTSFLSDKLNEGYPDKSDYLAAGYIYSQATNGVAGDTKPRTYDGWKLSKVIENLLINAYIDPELYYNKKRLLNAEDADVDSNAYLVCEHNNTYPMLLPKGFQYGNSLQNSNSDDKYNWQFSIGEQISDNVQKLMDNYGLNYGFNNRGNFFIESIYNPYKIKGIDELSFVGSWTEYTQFAEIACVGKYATTLTDKCVATMRGTAAAIIVHTGPSFGTIHIKVSNPTLGAVVTMNVSLNTSDLRYFKYGVDDTLGYNPCIINLNLNHKYGYYSINLTPKFISTGTLALGGIFIYDTDYNNPVETFYSSDYLTNNGVLIDSLSVNSNISNIRNDIIVVGKLTGEYANLAVDEENSITANINNPIEQHILARALDRVSIGSMSNSSYSGRKLQMIVIDPKFVTENHALWLAGQTALRYNETRKSFTPQINIIGNPLISVGDFVHVKDINTGILGTMHNFWVEDISDSYDANGIVYRTTLKLSSFKPWESFYNYPIASLKRFEHNVFNNIKLYNIGLPIENDTKPVLSEQQLIFENNHLGAPQNVATIAIKYTSSRAISYNVGDDLERLSISASKSILEERVPTTGYIKIHNEIIRYLNREMSTPKIIYSYTNGTISGITSVVATIYLQNLKRGIYQTATINVLSAHKLLPVEMQINPYAVEEFGQSPSVQFDLMAPGYIRVKVVDHMGVLVSYLTGSASIIDDSTGWEYLDTGKYVYTWNMTDEVGTHNLKNSGFFKYETDSVKDLPKNGISILDEWREYFGSSTGEGDTIYTIQTGGYYAYNVKKEKYGKFYFILEYRDLTKTFSKELITVSNLPQINSVIRIRGFGVAEANGIDEKIMFEPHNNHSIIPYRTYKGFENTKYDLMTVNWEAAGRHLLTDLYNPTNGYNEHYCDFYTGQENDGKGLRISLKGHYNISRIVNLDIKRYIYVLRLHIYDTLSSPRVVKAMVEQIASYKEDVTEGNGFFNSIKGSNEYDTIYLKAPAISWIPDSEMTTINGVKTYNILGQNTGNVKSYKVAYAHLHVIKIIATDFAGQKSIIGKSIWYISPSRYNPWGTSTANLLRNPLNNTVFEAIQFKYANDNTGPYIWFPELRGYDIYPPLLYHVATDANIDPDSLKNGVQKNIVIGVVEWADGTGMGGE